jgi:CubicO group peptidase (beta-lactamase class C family)
MTETEGAVFKPRDYEDPPGWRRIIAVIVLVSLAAIAAALLIIDLPPSLTRGVWLSEGDPAQIVLEFENAGGLVSGTMHELRENKLMVQWGFAGTRKKDGMLELSWGFNNTLRIETDLRAGELRGRLQRGDGKELDVKFHRVNAAAVPGLASQEDLPYRLRRPDDDGGWEVAAPSKVGIDPQHLEAMYRAVTRGEAGLIHSLLVIREGKLVGEEYFHGYSRQDLHELQSATKSVTSLLIGIARDRGYLRSLDDPVLEFFPEYAGSARPGWEEVTLRHLLTMTAGLDWDQREVNQAHGAGPELFEKVLSRRVVHDPGSRWLYNGAEVNLLAGVILRATGMQADAFAARHLFEPLGIAAWDWEVGKKKGFPSLAGTLHLQSLDMAKIGQLVLDRGRWQGKQVVSEEWIAESTAPTIATPREAQRYGYLWWRVDAPLDLGRHPVIVASGWGSQFIHIVPALDAVIVTTGGNHLNRKTFAIDGVLLRNLVPGLRR